MTFRFNHFSSFAVRLICTGLVVVAMCSPVHAVDFAIENEADYQAMLDGFRAAEYVRQQILEEGAPPRLLIASAGLWVFAERNPLATPEQLAEFIAQFDAQLAQAVPGDPDLFSRGAVQAALEQPHVERTPLLEGMDTRVSSRMLDLLGMSLPGLGGYDQSRFRMSQFELASVQRLIYRAEVTDFLVALLSGRTPDGLRRVMLAETVSAYLTIQGVSPLLGQTDPSQVEINLGLEVLPEDFLAFDSLRKTESLLEQVKDEVISDLQTIQDQGDLILAELNSPEPALEQAVDNLALMAAASDPSNPNHAAAIAELEAIEQALIDRLRETAEARVAVFANTLLMRQASFDNIQAAGVASRDFAALQLQTNNSLATMQETAGIMGSVIGVGIGIIREDPWETIQSLTNVFTSAFGLADLLGDQGPSAEEQIFNQIVAMREQLQDMQLQLNARLDAVDQKLDLVFTTMNDQFELIGDQIGELQTDVDELSANVAEVRSGLERIENALFGFAQELFLNDLLQETNLVLNYRQNTGVDLPYSFGSPNFIQSASFFHTFATSTSKGVSFAGIPDDQPLVITLDNAVDVLGEDPVARRINELRRVPAGLQTADGMPVQGPLIAGRVAAPAPWAQGASAYLQLANESPWYFNFLIANQGVGNPSAQINQLIRDGERIVELANATRAREDLFDGLFGLMGDRIEILQMAIDGLISEQLQSAPQLTNGEEQVDLWGPLDQSVSAISQSINSVQWEEGTNSGAFDINVSSALFDGFEFAVTEIHDANGVNVPRQSVANRIALAHLFRNGAQVRAEPLISSDDLLLGSETSVFEFDISSSVQGQPDSKRFLRAQVQVNELGNWAGLGFVPTCFGCRFTPNSFIERAWEALSQDLLAGDVDGRAYATGTLFFGLFPPIPFESRIVILSDSSETDGTLPVLDSFLAQQLFERRTTARAELLAALQTLGSSLESSAVGLDNATALLDAYSTLGLGDALSQSEVLRSALRGLPGIAGLGIRGGDVRALLQFDQLQDTGQVDYEGAVNPSSLDARLITRLDGLRSELSEILNTEAPSFPYVELILAQLRALRDQAPRLAIDETYLVDGNLAVSRQQGLLANDIGQAGEINDNELAIDLVFFSTPEAIQPSHGELLVQEDGSFSYQPDPGFSGEDRFSYRLRAQVGSTAPSGLAVSEPGLVVLRVIDTSSDTIFGDSFD